jgi:hypothetical protein
MIFINKATSNKFSYLDLMKKSEILNYFNRLLHIETGLAIALTLKADPVHRITFEDSGADI